MNTFILRFLIFSFLWAMVLYEESENLPISFLSLAILMVLYFLLSLKKNSFPLFIGLSTGIVLHSYFVETYFYTIMLLLYMSVFSLFRLKAIRLYMYISFNFLFSIILLFIGSANFLKGITILGFISFLTLTAHYFFKRFLQIRDEYKDLERDFRTIKRQNLSTEQTARMEERTKIMRELHDSVGHQLTALIMKLEMLAIEKKDESFREVKSMAEESLHKTRQAVNVLQLEDSEGIATVVQLIRKLESESQMVIQFTLKEGVLGTSLTNKKNSQLYRIIQEALTNAMRHASSREVQVSLGKTAIGHISFEVRNKIEGARPFEFGFGLNNMKERIKEINGKLSIYQTKDEFVLSGSFPVEEDVLG